MLGIAAPLGFIAGIITSMARNVKVVETTISVDIPNLPAMDSNTLESLGHFNPSVKGHAIIGNAVGGGPCAILAIAIKCFVYVSNSACLAEGFDHEWIVYPTSSGNLFEANTIRIKEILAIDRRPKGGVISQ